MNFITLKNTLSFVVLYCYIYVSWRGRRREEEGGRKREGGRGGRETLEDVHSLWEGSEAESEGGSGKERERGR